MLNQVEATLTNDPENEDLNNIKADLLEVIGLKETSMQQPQSKAATETAPGECFSQSKAATETSAGESYSLKRPWHQANWKQGDKCRAPWPGDQRYCVAIVDEVLEDGSCSVVFDKYNTTEVTQVYFLRPCGAESEDDEESTYDDDSKEDDDREEDDDKDSGRPKSKKGIWLRARKKKKAMKNAQHLKQQDKNQSVELNAKAKNKPIFSKKGDKGKSLFKRSLDSAMKMEVTTPNPAKKFKQIPPCELAELQCQDDISFIINKVNDARDEMTVFETKAFRLQVLKADYRGIRDIMQTFTKNTSKKLFVVIDTNAFLKDLHLLKKLKVNMTSRLNDSYAFVIPWLIIQEIDYLKDKQLNSKKYDLNGRARSAVNLFHDWLKTKDPEVFWQNPREAASLLQEFDGFVVEKADDKLLHCCLLIKNKNPDSTIFLLSNDTNLRNKGMILGMETYSTKALDDWVMSEESISFTTVPIKASNAGEDVPAVDLAITSASSELDWSRCLSSSHIDMCENKPLDVPKGPAVKRFIPLLDRILVDLVGADTKMKGGILIPEEPKGKVLEAKVVAVGPGVWSSKGDLIPVDVVVGDRVSLLASAGIKIVVAEKEYLLLNNHEILGKFL